MNLRFPLTKEKLKTHFAYAWWQYVLVVVLALFCWNLLFTTTHYRSPAHLKVEWYYDAYQAEAEQSMDELMAELHASLLSDMEEVNFVPVVLDNAYGPMQLTVWFSAGEGDLFMLNEESFRSMASNGGIAELTPYIEDGSLQVGDLDLKKGKVTDLETGKSRLCGIPAELLPGLEQYGLVCEGEYLCLSVTGGNLDNTMKLLNWLVQNMQ